LLQGTLEVAVLIAVPEFHGCVSPTFDFCHRVTLWRLDEKGLRKTGERRCESLRPWERSAKLQDMEVDVLLCGAIGNELARDIKGRGIQVIHGLTGEVAEVVAAFASKTLDHPKFRMPGAPAPNAQGGGRREVEP
jgi:predicted Fe-Mo cluster-binding NifX family protein